MPRTATGTGSGPRATSDSPAGGAGGHAASAGPASRTASTKPAAAAAGAAPGRTASITPAGALVRHIEWLAFALTAARSEETWRAGRLDKATTKNREKRTLRLAEVREEIAELSALIEAIHGLQARAARNPAETAARSRGAGPRKTRARPLGAAQPAATTPRTRRPAAGPRPDVPG